ncbi:small GTP-binding protein Rab7, putative [Trypanosoma equiperdum]|uniref:Small GTP-binding protein Rab7, putative n=5 Tax=Trypanozoon TaxID=39700 RepID=D6XLJ7_TRYB2|nr:small GTP-binding protein Rab7, putative [Trypanosoma brucei gambiense DAL972]XP_847293.1 small GTP-binding protein Rab7, putative [Trypanosoma brucei brucei TREU927]AAX70580.1 small GTP-binding protein Rab7, putative [Trypanosoma brucei]RHW70775.1 small GTP-binding protein Rab7 [Trypanosoma brucei equiperdum]CAA68210.1 rab7 [Trypanosoma brucei brucei]SCU69375.1 small GTP-binding protein Rab7, putative [Trypanosoma equiperdum]AAZ13227.1 small GTP-binding protein Rab7, putative [Trypanosoma|eukprot:XP_011775778.1 small GTP-binding protein Rab7, putative [Trypanosoma brucei gambiense DAL972]
MKEEPAYKIIVIGDVGVGKSNISSRFCDSIYYDDIVPTIGVDFKYCHTTTLEKHARTILLQIWDTSGQDRFVSLTTAYYRNCHGALICFDLTNRSSFEGIDAWFERLRSHCPVLPPLILVGCKLDLVECSELHKEGTSLGICRQVEKSEADAWAKRHGCLCYFETSSRNNTNVSEAFQHLGTYIVNNTTPTVEGHGDKAIGNIVRLNTSTHTKKRKWRC